jgi:hypothetical protein
VLCSLDDCQQYLSMNIYKPGHTGMGAGAGLQTRVRMSRRLKSDNDQRLVCTSACSTCCWPCNSLYPEPQQPEP